jgi:uncharacterized protein
VRPLLLDVNALVALAWPNHQFHHAVLQRLERKPAPTWATCSLTQLGFVRLSSNPSVVGIRKTPGEAIDVLADLVGDARHLYVDSLPPLDTVANHFRTLLGHQQVTDAYLVAVAQRAGATLLTLDRRLAAPAGTPELVELLTPARI